MEIAPYISDRRKRRRRIRAYLYVAAGLAVLYGIFFIAQWIVLHSPLFRVDHVTVTGNSSVPSDAIVSLAEGAALRDHGVIRAALTFRNMLLWPDRIPQADLAMVPQAADVTVSKDFFSHTVTLTVTERTPIGIWCYTPPPVGGAGQDSVATGTVPVALSAPSAGNTAPCFWFDNTGTLFERASETQGSLVYAVYDTAERARGLNEKVLSADFLPNFASIVSVLRASGLGVREILLSDLSLQEVTVVTGNGPRLYFSLQFPADEYLPVIKKLMVLPSFGKMQYIDCLTEHRLYYK